MIDKELLRNSANTLHRDFLLTLADHAEEGGDCDLSAAYRWMAENRMWPMESCHYQGAVFCYWQGGGMNHLGRRYGDSHRLPFSANRWLGILNYDNCYDALDKCAHAISRWLKKTNGKPCWTCEGIGSEWTPVNKITCRTCNGSGQDGTFR